MASERQPAACLRRFWNDRFAGPKAEGPGKQPRFTPLAEAPARILTALATFLETSIKIMDGPRFQEYLGDCLRDGIDTKEDLWSWLLGRPEPGRRCRTSFDAACRHAAHLHAGGVWVASLREGSPLEGKALQCPNVLFGRGPNHLKSPLVAWFNSRKPRLIQPDAPWMQALRTTLTEVASLSGTFASSEGTLTYNLVSAFAMAGSLPLLRCMPDSLNPQDVSDQPETRLTESPAMTALACQIGHPRCPQPTRWICRDRMLAHLADAHIALELRASSRLCQILTEQHRRSPRALWVFGGNSAEAPMPPGNRELLDHFPGHARVFRTVEQGRATLQHAGAAPSGLIQREPLGDVGKDYLYHYTRSCPGPWPGEELHDHLLRLLQGDPSSAHTAIDTLARILNEQRVRASHLLVRGKHPVVSLTSRPPHELDAFRRWNRSKARWTLEPCGIAVKKILLRRMGAKPTIYGDASVYGSVPPRERYRFQLSTRRSSWAAEREWRLNGDLWLKDIAPEDYFVFVPSRAHADRLATLITGRVRCAIGDGGQIAERG